MNKQSNSFKGKQTCLFDTTNETKPSRIGQAHDLFIKIEGMTPAEYKNGGQNLTIEYAFYNSLFGNIIIASTPKGICFMAFYENKVMAVKNLMKTFPKANFNLQTNKIHQKAICIFQKDWNELEEIKLHLKGTNFQLKVWETLLKIPMGQLTTYGSIAQQIQQPTASRAVGTAIGSNPIAFLIPCHRVIQASGKIGGYMWGNTRKTAIIGWESAQMDTGKE